MNTHSHTPPKKDAATPAGPLEWAKALSTPVATVLTTVFVGYYGSGVLKDRETQQANERLYTQLLIQRESSDATIRKDMFGVVIKEFLNEMPKADWNKNILQLELLGSNFNQSLDLAPLFKDIARRLAAENKLPPDEKLAYQERLDRTASALNLKQINTLKRRGFEAFRTVGIGRDWRSDELAQRPVLAATISATTLQAARQDTLQAAHPDTPLPAGDELDLTLQILDVDLAQGEIDVRLRAHLHGHPEDDIDRHFLVGRYDFPMLDNVQLQRGLRAAVVVTRFLVPDTPDAAERAKNSLAALHLVVFPATSASFKERQDYDDVLFEMLRKRPPVSGAAGAKDTGG